MEHRDHYVLIPSPDRSAVLVSGDPNRPRLPAVRGRPGAAGVLAALRQELDLVIPYLRPAHLLREGDGNPFAALHELDAPAPGWEPAHGLSWASLAAVDPAALAGEELERPVSAWLGHQQGVPLPDDRPPWARPGWLASAEAWIAETCDALGLEQSAPPEVVEQWPISSVLRIETSGGRLYFKAAFSIFRHEPGVTVALALDHPELVPEVVAIDEGRGWLLMRELPGTPLGDEDAGLWAEGLRAMGRIHRGWARRRADIRDLGAPNRALESLERELDDVLSSGVLEDELRARLDAVRPELQDLLARVAGGPLPETLVHGDLHPWNVMADVTGSAAVRIFDWSDACFAHPLFDLATFLPRAGDASARDALLDAYLQTWSDHAPLDELRDLAELALPLAQIHHARSYVRILDALEAADRWFFAEVPAALVLDAVERIEARRIRRP